MLGNGRVERSDRVDPGSSEGVFTRLGPRALGEKGIASVTVVV